MKDGEPFAIAGLWEQWEGQDGEVIEAIRTEPWQPAELGKLECRKDFVYNVMWNQRHYGTKQVRPVFVEEPGEIVVVTVYVYYF